LKTTTKRRRTVIHAYMTALKYILLLEPNIPRAVEFYQRGLGATLHVATNSWAELYAGDTTIALKHQGSDTSRPHGHGSNSTMATSSETMMTTGGSKTPMLVFDVDNVQDRLTRLLEMGARMDGGVQYTLEGSRLAVVQSPSGYLVGIVGE